MLKPLKLLVIFSVLVWPTSFVSAHTLVLPQFLASGSFFRFLYEGIRHIIPLGLDHILFILTVFLYSRSLKKIAKYSLIFTLAHSITLALVVTGVLFAPGEIVEPIIALSIFVLAIDLIYPFIASHWHGLVIFAFGLFHGMGFAGVLKELGFSRTTLLSSLAGFNIGVEVGQLIIITAAYCLTWKFFKNETMRNRIVFSSAVVIAAVSGFWFLERIFLNFF